MRLNKIDNYKLKWETFVISYLSKMNSEVITAESVIEALPRILTERPDILYEVYTIIDKKFSTKDDFIRILIEIEKSREESNRRFEAIDKRFEEARGDLKKQERNPINGLRR